MERDAVRWNAYASRVFSAQPSAERRRARLREARLLSRLALTALGLSVRRVMTHVVSRVTMRRPARDVLYSCIHDKLETEERVGVHIGTCVMQYNLQVATSLLR